MARGAKAVGAWGCSVMTPRLDRRPRRGRSRSAPAAGSPRAPARRRTVRGRRGTSLPRPPGGPAALPGGALADREQRQEEVHQRTDGEDEQDRPQRQVATEQPPDEDD